MAKRNFDSEFCGSLPLNNVNLIQDYGYLLVAEKSELNIIQVSENAEDLFGMSCEEIISSNINTFISDSDSELLRSLIKKGLKVPVNLTLNGSLRSVLLHVKDSYIILEIEKTGSIDNRYFTTVFNEIKYAIAAIETASTVTDVSIAAVHELRKISGFDGVLMYRFDPDWNGTVIAEEKTDKLEAYMGQTFPASDIPKQARELYLKNPYRQIPDRNYESFGLYPVVNPVTNAFLDLSDCNLRSVPSVHREYMKNMAISASMSIRVLRNNTLWGLISCHHIEPKYIDLEMCAIFEMLSTVISSRVSSILYKEEFDFAEQLQKKRLEISNHIYKTGDLTASLLGKDNTNVLQLFQASGAVLLLNGQVEKTGNVPDSIDIENLRLWIDSKELREVFATDNIQSVYEDAVHFKDIASGLLVIPLDHRRSEYLFCFRQEVEATIDWGGNPNNAITFDKDGKNYHPRNSFTLWKEKLENHSLPWKQQEIEAASALSGFLYEFRTRNSEV